MRLSVGQTRGDHLPAIPTKHNVRALERPARAPPAGPILVFRRRRLVLASLGYRVASMAVAAVVLSVAIPDRTCAEIPAAAIEALLASGHGDFAQARQLAALSEDPVVDKLVLWMDATSSSPSASFAEITGFVIDNPEWPQQKLLRQKAEQKLDPGTSDLAVLSWFEHNQPLTLPGAKRFAYALIAAGEDARAGEVARTAWRNADAQAIEDEDDFYIAFGHLLTNEDHAQRIRPAAVGRSLGAGAAHVRSLGCRLSGARRGSRGATSTQRPRPRHGCRRSGGTAGRTRTGLRPGALVSAQGLRCHGETTAAAVSRRRRATGAVLAGAWTARSRRAYRRQPGRGLPRRQRARLHPRQRVRRQRMARGLDCSALPAAARGRGAALFHHVRERDAPGEPRARRLLVRARRRGDG